MNISRRIVSMVVAIAVVSVVQTLPPTASEASSCVTEELYSTAQDRAWTLRTSGDDCEAVWVKHQYDPIWSQINYWTPKYVGRYGAATPSTPELIDHAHGIYY